MFMHILLGTETLEDCRKLSLNTESLLKSIEMQHSGDCMLYVCMVPKACLGHPYGESTDPLIHVQFQQAELS